VGEGIFLRRILKNKNTIVIILSPSTDVGHPSLKSMNLYADPNPDPDPIFGILSILDPEWKKTDINLNYVTDPDRHTIDADPDPEK
jgi:hypothetical protein